MFRKYRPKLFCFVCFAFLFLFLFFVFVFVFTEEELERSIFIKPINISDYSIEAQSKHCIIHFTNDYLINERNQFSVNEFGYK